MEFHNEATEEKEVFRGGIHTPLPLLPLCESPRVLVSSFLCGEHPRYNRRQLPARLNYNP